MCIRDRLAANTGRKKVAKNRHLRTIAQLCWVISSQQRHILTIGKKPVKQQYLLHMPSQYGELRPTSGWDLLASLGHPSKFQRVSHFGSVTARHSSTRHQPNFVALNRGRHLYSAGWPSRWALAHILVMFFFTVQLSVQIYVHCTTHNCFTAIIWENLHYLAPQLRFCWSYCLHIIAHGN